MGSAFPMKKDDFEPLVNGFKAFKPFASGRDEFENAKFQGLRTIGQIIDSKHIPFKEKIFQL